MVAVIDPSKMPRPQSPAPGADPGFFGSVGDWFGSMVPDFSWGSGNPPPPTAPFEPPKGSGTSTPWGGSEPLPPPGMPPVPPMGSGTSTAWGGPPQMPEAAATSQEDPYNVVNEVTPGEKYSFLDNPGASDALVAFGAAMLKAPSFNQGLGDAALAVNQVAQKYRMPTEQDYARAKQLGMVARIARGGNVTDPSQSGGGIEVDQKTSFYDQQGNLYWAASDANGNPGVWDPNKRQFIAGGVPGMVRATDSSVGATNRFGAKGDADAETQLYNDALAADDNIIQLKQLREIAPTAGIGLDGQTRLARQIVTLTGMPLGSIDPTSVSTLQASTRQLGLNWSQKMRGQGQVTEFERQQIVEMLPQSLQDPQAFNNLVTLLEQVEMRKKTIAKEWFSNQQELRQKYGSFRGYMLARVDEMPIAAPTTGTGAGAKNSTTTGTTSNGLKWSVE